MRTRHYSRRTERSYVKPCVKVKVAAYGEVSAFIRR